MCLGPNGEFLCSKKHDVFSDAESLFGIPCFSTISLAVVWGFAFVVSITAGSLADVFQGSLPTFPFGPIINTAVALNILCAIFSIFLGYSMWDSYNVYQPFAGGKKYVLLQFFGWTLVVTSSMIIVVYLLQLQPPKFRYGVITVLEGFASVGNVLLLLSVRSFAPSEARPRCYGVEDMNRVAPQHSAHGGTLTSLLQVMLHSPNSETGLIAFFLCLQLFLCIIGASFPYLVSLVMVIFTAFHLANGVLIYLVIMWVQKAKYKLFQGTIEMLCFSPSLLMYLLALAGGIVLIRVGASAPQLAFGFTALASFFGISSTLLLVRTTRLRDNTTELDFVGAKYGQYVLSFIASSLACIPVAIMYYLTLEEDRHLKDLYEEGNAWIEGLLFCQTLSVIFLLLLTFVTHLIGRVIYGDAFSFFQPFCGSSAFVVLQALGWAFFSASILCLTLHMTATNFLWILAAAGTGIIGQFFIQFSLGAFASDFSLFSTPASSSSSAFFFSSVVSPKTTDRKLADELLLSEESNYKEQGIFNGELILSLLLQLTSIILRLIADISTIWLGGASFVSIHALIGFASLAFVVSVPLAHYSGKSHGILLFAPFQGNGTYIALQALGWTTYALFALNTLVDCFFNVTGKSFEVFFYKRSSFCFTLEGLLQIVPLLLIVLSVAIEARHFISRRRGRVVVLKALKLIKKSLQERFIASDTSEQAELQMAMQIIASSCFFAHGIDYDMRNFFFVEESGHSCEETHKTKSTVPLPPELDWTNQREDLGANDKNESDIFFAFSRLIETRHGPATLSVLMMSLASASGYVIAALWATAMPLWGAVFAIVGLAVCTFSCVVTHCVYGAVLHGSTGMYTFFMPFRGGSVFVVLQIAGWVSYACVFIVTLLHAMEDVEHYITLPTGAFLSVCSQFFILFSVPKFDSRSRRETYLEQNGEGVVGMLLFIGAFFFAYIYFCLKSFSNKVDDGHPSIGLGDECVAVAPQLPKVPFLIIAVSMVAVVPFLLMTLGRSVKRCVKVAHSSLNNFDDDDDEVWGRHSSVIAYVVARICEITILLLGMISPIAFIFLIYHVIYSRYHGLFLFLEYFFQLVMVAGGFALLLSLVSHALFFGMQQRFIHFRQFLVTFIIYSTALICFVILFGPIILLPFHSVGAYYTASVSILLTLGARSTQLRIFLRFTVYAALGYATYLECIRLFCEEDDSTCVSLPITLLYYATDVGMLLFWLWYLPLYDGRPEETGAQRNVAFIRWMEKYIISDMERYFSFRLIQEDERVNMQDCNNKYIFSFHPHGVFAGTALFCTLTKAWRQKIGYNDKAWVVTHAASVLFNVPFARDINLRLGVLDVTRSVLNANLARGNSSLIVIGGQAELLLSERSDKVMSVVTYHHGFVKLALKQKTPLVPLLSFAEQNILGFFRLPTIQRITLRLFGFPFPMIFYGRWLLAAPHPTPLTVVVGSPVFIPPDASADNPKDVAELADKYFLALRELFYKHRAAAGYPNMELVYHSKK